MRANSSDKSVVSDREPHPSPCPLPGRGEGDPSALDQVQEKPVRQYKQGSFDSEDRLPSRGEGRVRSESGNVHRQRHGDYFRDVAPPNLRWRGRVLMLLLNFIPAIHAACTLLLLLLPYVRFPLRLAASLLFLYSVPPLVAR